MEERDMGLFSDSPGGECGIGVVFSGRFLGIYRGFILRFFLLSTFYSLLTPLPYSQLPLTPLPYSQSPLPIFY